MLLIGAVAIFTSFSSLSVKENCKQKTKSIKLQVGTFSSSMGLPTVLEAKQGFPNGVGPFQFCCVETVAIHTLKHQMGYNEWDFSL